MLDDLGEFSLPQAVEAFNRGVRAARKFYLELHAQPRFAQMGLRPYWHQGFRMWRNPASSALTQEEYWFQTTSVVSMYATNATDETHALFANFNLVATPEAAALCVGVCRVVEGHIVESFAFGTANEPATDPQVTAAVASGFPHTVIHRLGEWAFASRPWLPETGDKDIEWALEHLERAASTLAAAKGA